MGFLRNSRHETFIADHATDLVDGLAYSCATAARSICGAMRGSLPAQANEDTICMVLLAFRAAVETAEVRRKVGRRSAQVLLDVMDATYSSPDTRFSDLLRIVQDIIGSVPNPQDWLRRISMKLLGTWDPDDELFHCSLAEGVLTSERIMVIVERHLVGGVDSGDPSPAKTRLRPTPVDLSELRQGLRGKPYRELIKLHLDRESALELETATQQTILMLPDEVLDQVGAFIDKWNQRVFDAGFWSEDCAAVLDAITTEAYVWIVPQSARLSDEDLFNIFQIVTLNYAFMAAKQANVRGLIGIR